MSDWTSCPCCDGDGGMTSGSYPDHEVRGGQYRATPAPLDVRIAAIFAEHRECGKPNGYDGCYSHWPMLPHCRADGMALPCDVMRIAALTAKDDPHA